MSRRIVALVLGALLVVAVVGTVGVFFLSQTESRALPGPESAMDPVTA